MFSARASKDLQNQPAKYKIQTSRKLKGVRLQNAGRLASQVSSECANPAHLRFFSSRQVVVKSLSKSKSRLQLKDNLRKSMATNKREGLRSLYSRI